MVGSRRPTNVPSLSLKEAHDESITIPDFATEFLPYDHLQAFARALSAPDDPPGTNGLNSPVSASRSSFDSLGKSRQSLTSPSQQSLFITAQNDWAPVNKRVKPARRKGEKQRPKPSIRSKDETREGYVYTLLKWPFLAIVVAWVAGLGTSYLLTRLYIWLYEHFVAWRGKKEKLRGRLHATTHYSDWVAKAKELDTYLGNDAWKMKDEYVYYDHKTVRRVVEQLRRIRHRIESNEKGVPMDGTRSRSIEELKSLVEACVKSNFVGVENARLYSQTYYGTKTLVQNFIDEVERGIAILQATTQLGAEEKRSLFKRMYTNYGRTALCLSGGASFAYYHFGVVKALLDSDLLPDVITGTSGGALVAALVATRTNEELKKILVPALAGKINACSEPFSVWGPRWWRTGARFDSLNWAKGCSWFTRGSMTFQEAYERTGRILNVSCIPADPHSPTMILNYLTASECVIWSAVLASAAVPGILNPVVLMMKQRDGTLTPYSFGHKWKDGSLRTDIPLKALNLHFNVNFSIVSQVNPHINLFFFSARGSIGHPVTHRRGRGWRGGYLGSATEQYLKLDLNKWLKVLRHLELLPRPLGQDWSEIWLQQFSGTITIWPRSVLSDFWHILSDPDPARLLRMLHVGQQSAFPKLKFLENRLKVERRIEAGRRETRPPIRRGSIENILSEDDMESLLIRDGEEPTDEETLSDDEEEEKLTDDEAEEKLSVDTIVDHAGGPRGLKRER